MHAHEALATAAFCGAAVLLAGCAPPAERAAAAPAPPEVECLVVYSTRARVPVQLPGSVTALHAATLTAPVSGQVRSVSDEGAQLAAGQQAALLEGMGLQAQVTAARAAVGAAEHHEESAQTAVKQAT